MKNILLTLLFALITLPSHAFIRGINKADKVIKLKNQKCHIFKEFIVVERLSDKKSADRIAVRTLKNASPEVACSSDTLRGEVVLNISSELVYGVRGDFIFNEVYDGARKLNAIKVYSIKSPEALQNLTYHMAKDFIVTDLKNSLALEFYTQLKLTCTLASQGDECWEKIKRENGMTKEQVVGKPDCEDVYRGHAFKTNPELKNNPAAVQVFALVKIPDIRSKEKNFLKSQATCDAAL